MPHFIFIQQISELNILSILYNLHFFSSKCRLFRNATLFSFCITHILNTECAKIWRKKSVGKRLTKWKYNVLYEDHVRPSLSRYQRLNLLSFFFVKFCIIILCKAVPSGRARSKTLFGAPSLGGITGSISASGMDVYLLRLLRAVRCMSLCCAYHSSRGVLPTVVCLSMIVELR